MFSPVITYDLYLMAKAGSPAITSFCNETLLHPLEALIYLETANKYIENLKSETGNELLSTFALFCVVRETILEHLFPKLQANLVQL